MDDFVTIQHPDIDGAGMCSAAAFDLIYQAKGWRIVPDDATPADQATDSGPDAATAPPAPPAPAPVNLMES